MSAPFLEFAQLCAALAATSKTLKKQALIADYLKTLQVEDAARAALYFAGQPFAETDGRALNAGGALLTNALMRLSGADERAMGDAYRSHGDLGAAAYDLFIHKNGRSSLTLEEVEQFLAGVSAAKGPAAKLVPLLALLDRAMPIEAKYLVKLCLGDMRTGVKQGLIEEAIAAAFHAGAVTVRHALMLTGSLPEVVRLAAASRLHEARMRLFHPLGFMLASPVDSVGKALARFAQEVAEERKDAPQNVSVETALHEAQLEDKYDGMRAQLHCGDANQPGRVGLFSRNREDIGAAFPELIEGFAQIDEAAILDGEVLAWKADEQRALPFSSLQQRLGRKRVTPEMQTDTPVVFMAFDLLYFGSELLLERPLHQRRQRLEAFVERHAPVTARAQQRGQSHLFGDPTPGFPRLLLAPALPLKSAEQLEQAYADARARGNEGVMLKARNSIYQPGRRGLAWLKLKRELATLDVVVTGAEFGHGKRAGVLSDYTFAVRDGDALKNVGKAYSGLTDAEIADLTVFFKAHTLEDFGSFRTVKPVLVLEVAFNNVMRSERHASGFALRFPRILRIRRDKPVNEIDTLSRVEEIYNSQPDRPVK